MTYQRLVPWMPGEPLPADLTVLDAVEGYLDHVDREEARAAYEDECWCYPARTDGRHDELCQRRRGGDR